MLGCDGLAALRRHADEALAEGQPDVADGLGVEADRGAERQMTEIGVRQIERTDIRVEALGHEVDDVRQRLLEVVRPRDDLGDVSE